MYQTPESITNVLTAAVADSAWPGGVLNVGHSGRIVLREAFGCHTYASERPTHTDDVFDLASLTKVVATTSAVMALVDGGKIELDDRVATHLPEFADATDETRRDVTVRQLLAHCSGLPAWSRFWEIPGGRAARVGALLRTPLEAPPGTRTLYSDVGFMVLGELVAAVSGMPLDQYVDCVLTKPLEMSSTTFNPVAPDGSDGDAAPAVRHYSRIVPTERCPDGNSFLCGTVHDENARGLEGVAGHAGLFSTADDLAAFAQMLLNQGSHNGKIIFRPETTALFTRRADVVPGSSRCLGWDSPTDGCSGGPHLSPASFGHTGFTGTSLWIDPTNALFVILLTNAVHPDRAEKEPACSNWRRRIHATVYEAVGLPGPTVTKTDIS